jgi:hypothetical protein
MEINLTSIKRRARLDLLNNKCIEVLSRNNELLDLAEKLKVYNMELPIFEAIRANHDLVKLIHSFIKSELEN